MRWTLALFYGLAHSFAVPPALTAPGRPNQQVLAASTPDQHHDTRPFYVREQGDDVCKAGGKHYTGKVDVSPDKSLFFCEWRNYAKTR